MKKPNLNLPRFQIRASDINSIISLVLPFFLIDLFIRLTAITINYHMILSILPSIIFNVSWIIFICLFSVCFKKPIGKIVYTLLFFMFFAIFICQIFYFQYAERFFSFKVLEASAGVNLNIREIIKHADFFVYLECVVVLVSGIVGIINFPNAKKTYFIPFPLLIAAFIVVHAFTPITMGISNKKLAWDSWRNPRNVYSDFIDSNKNMKICGFYEYTIRDLYRTFLKQEPQPAPQDVSYLKDAYSQTHTHKENDYTGIFKGKNVIFLQLEGIDSWLLTKKDMPNLYSMMDSSMVFDNHYSFYNSGGSTFNSEFMVNTGFVTPLSYIKNAYTFTNNTFPYSLPNQLRNQGYSSNAFHMNSGEYYMRTLNYENWGYDDYYSLMDDCNYNDASYQLDRELILNDLFYEKMFKQKEPFMDYIISYTPHTPFKLKSKLGKMLTKKVYTDKEDIPEMDEEAVARFYAAETDRMIGLLMKALKDNGLYENTVIVAFSDHYLYTLDDQTILDKYKTTENNLVNNTPFMIWSHNMDKKTISKVNSQLDILPTILNMLGIEYTDEYYIGHDIMDEAYDGFVFFNDYSWYDGTNYVEKADIENGTYTDVKGIIEKNDMINNLIKRNDLTLKCDYFRKR